MRKIHRLDLIGEKFGMLTVTAKAGKNPRGEILWECSCDCGVITSVRANNLRKGGTKSCGCGQLASVTTHGMTGTPTFRSWDSMKQRCLNPNAPDYARYGGRGIGICKEWTDSFEVFWQDMGTRPAGKTLDRIDNSGPYSKQNCRWATPRAQVNNRRNTRFVIWQDRKWPLTELAEKHSLKPEIIVARLGSGWTLEKALTEPVMLGRGRKAPTKGLN